MGRAVAIFGIALVLVGACTLLNLFFTCYNIATKFRTASRRFACAQIILMSPQALFFLPVGVVGLVKDAPAPVAVIALALGIWALVLAVCGIWILARGQPSWLDDESTPPTPQS
jgi:hypothetical protein